jgi:hypothetical protein
VRFLAASAPAVATLSARATPPEPESRPKSGYILLNHGARQSTRAKVEAALEKKGEKVRMDAEAGGRINWTAVVDVAKEAVEEKENWVARCFDESNGGKRSLAELTGLMFGRKKGE